MTEVALAGTPSWLLLTVRVVPAAIEPPVMRVSRARLSSVPARYELPPTDGPRNEPCRSTIRWVGWLAATQIRLEAPTLTGTSPEVVTPFEKVTFDAPGLAVPHGNTVSDPFAAGAEAVTFTSTVSAHVGKPWPATVTCLVSPPCTYPPAE